jgi:signal transduction histidine kinase
MQIRAGYLVKPKLISWLDISLSAAILVVLVLFGYTLLFEIPYLGFLVEPPDGLITIIQRGNNPAETLHSGDFLVQVNGVTWQDLPIDNRYPLLSELEQNANIALVVRRNQELVPVFWTVTGVTVSEFLYRLVSAWWLPLAFWLAGAATYLLVRPKDTRWRLLFLYFYLLALAFSAGVLSPYGYLATPEILRSSVWLLLPVSWHLHWLFPRPIGPLPKGILWLLYGLAGIMALVEWFFWLPMFAYLVGFLLAVFNIVVLLLLHAVFQSDQRRNVGIFLAVLFLISLPIILGAFNALKYEAFPAYVNFAVLFLPAIAGVYFWIIYRGRAGDMEIRTNRLITAIFYGGIILALTVFVSSLAKVLLPDPHYYLSIAILLTIIFSLITVFIYPLFQRWIEHRLLGIPMPPTQLLERYTTRMTTSLGTGDLVTLLRDEVLPSMLIRQAVLLRLDKSSEPVEIFSLGVKENQLPNAEQVPSLLVDAGKYPRSGPDSFVEHVCDWAYLILNLSLSGQTIGVCLFGKRDPDDFYTKSDIGVLQALMDQTALALVNIDQAERLRALYQKDIERQEMERSHLARELHDDVLNQLGMLWMIADEQLADERFVDAYQISVSRIREIISGLRPGMLMYGLRFALEELSEETTTQVGGDIPIVLEVPTSDSRYPPDVELHLFRIVQQACQNALKHSQAQCIYLRGILDHSRVELSVEDDGIGFLAGEHLDLAQLLANKHFGLAGMHERAALIGAQMWIDSAPGKGTRVRIMWDVNSQPPA